MTLYDPVAEWASLVVGSLADAGVRDVVLSPGSRSTPFVLACAREPGLRLYDVIDERAAAFFALGQARASGRPSLCLCTSGTAAAHYFPAVIEAGLAGVPLLLLTADRPLELQHCAAPQTIDQVKLFGAHARAFFELGAADSSDGALAMVRRLAAQAFATAMGARPGAVHLNVRAKKPLEPHAATENERQEAERVRAARATPLARVFAARARPSDEAVAALADLCDGARRGLIVCGPAPLGQAAAREAVQQLSAATGYPLLAEAPSQLRSDGTCDAFDALLRNARFARAHVPELVLQLGAPPTSSALERYLAQHAVARAVIAPHGWPDPSSRACLLIEAELGATAAATATRVRRRPDGEWAARFAAANAVAWQQIEHTVGEPGPLGEAEVARATVRSVPRDGLLVVGNSLPIRQVDAWCPASSLRCGILSQRGANGIDGLVAGAAGAASDGKATTLLLGDVSLLHDLGGLYLAARARVPLVLVVVNNGGGRIFEQLPLGKQPLADETMAHFTTPHSLCFAHAAALYGLRHQRVDERHALTLALAEAQAHAGCTLVEAMVPPHGAAALHAALDARLDAALAHARLDAAIADGRLA